MPRPYTSTRGFWVGDPATYSGGVQGATAVAIDASVAPETNPRNVPNPVNRAWPAAVSRTACGSSPPWITLR
ncbi:MAG: hypothetical protein U0939_21115 [Pirellulales bacterium]